ncbi:MAG: GNAT family N-acetyltransferase [Methanotrichaceae archaeon]
MKDNEMDKIIIRKFESRDFSDVVKMDVESKGNHDPYLFTFFYENYHTTFLVAESKGKIIGMIMGFRQSPLDGRVFWIVVRPENRGRKIGRKLMIRLLDIFRKLGVLRVILEVRIGNKKAQSLYRDLGFEMVTYCPNYYPDGEAAIIMRKPL